VALSATLVVVVAELARPFPLKLVIDALAEHGASGRGVELSLFIVVGALVVGIALAEAGGTYAADLAMRRAAEGIVHDLRVAVYSHLQRLSLRFHDRRATGDLVTRLTGDVNAVGELYGESVHRPGTPFVASDFTAASPRVWVVLVRKPRGSRRRSLSQRRGLVTSFHPVITVLGAGSTRS